jgi:hypothetical protein
MQQQNYRPAFQCGPDRPAVRRVQKSGHILTGCAESEICRVAMLEYDII